MEFSPNVNFEDGPPSEDDLAKYFTHLRNEKNMASSTMWTMYSYINSIMQRKYAVKLPQAEDPFEILRQGREAQG